MGGNNTKLKKFDPATIMDGVKDKIKAEFINLMPEGAWLAMVKTEVNRYFKETVDTRHHYNNQRYTPFAILIHNLLEQKAKERFKEYLNTPQFKETWDSKGKSVMSEAVKKFIIENSVLEK